MVHDLMKLNLTFGMISTSFIVCIGKIYQSSTYALAQVIFGSDVAYPAFILNAGITLINLVDYSCLTARDQVNSNV